MMYAWIARLGLAAGLLAAPVAQAQVDLESFIRKDSFGNLVVSPDGTYLAASVPLEDRTGLVILRRSDLTKTAQFALGEDTHIESFTWVSNERLLISMAQKLGALDKPQLTGELYSINADGSDRGVLVGYRAGERSVGTRLKPGDSQMIAAFLVDELPEDDKNVVVMVWPFGEDPYTRAERMDVRSGKRILIARSPVQRADFLTDNAGIVRFAFGAGADNNNQLYHRAGDGAPWELISDEVGSGVVQTPVGFSADNNTAYLLSQRADGPDVLVALDLATRKQTELLSHDVVDPHLLLRKLGSDALAGALFMHDRPSTAFFDDESKEAKLYRMLEQAFPGEAVRITSSTRDGRLALVNTWSDRNPGDFYLFNTETKKAGHIVSRNESLDTSAMGTTRVVSLKARDGLQLHGYLTVPAGSSGKNLPMVVMPHGGPFGVYDTWGFEPGATPDLQLLARAGYAVMQINFRGSGGYGMLHEEKGARQWGRTMQDDVTDATKWAIGEGIADRGRICIYGASYGAYASLMGVAKEPALYKCAVGYVGVYDLPMMHSRGDIQERRSGETYIREWIGPVESLAAVSPTNMASRIKVPVFLAAGGEDQRTPIEHTELMERKLRGANVPVETLYYKTEGHGFYTEPHRREYYTKLLDFLSRHIGGAKAK